ncbi:MAG: DUF4270 domain-containing protein [Prevotella sp.]|nr:DUF4270 domain-containing protein [Prevotella sp.]
MLKTFQYMAAAAFALVAISSCKEDELNIGQSLTNESDKLAVTTEIFNVTTRTIMADSVLSLSADCYLGSVRDPQTGADVISEFTTQFHLLEKTSIAEESEVTSRYNGRAAADSCDLILYISSPFRNADSLTAMKMRVSEMAVPLEEGIRYYSNFNPMRAGMVREGGISKSHVFTFANLGELDGVRTASSYQDCIRIPLNEPYTATDGTVYNNYGTYLMQQYYDHPEYFRNSFTFTHRLCPGFFFQITDGMGFHAKVKDIGLRTYYTAKSDNKEVTGLLLLAGTREVLQTTCVTNDSETLKVMAEETQHTYLKTPAGLYTEVTLPVTQMKQDHEGDSLLAAKLTLQRLNNLSSDDRLLPVPQTLLLVQKDSLHRFFENNGVPDNIMSYITGFNNYDPVLQSGYSNTNTYTFSNLSALITSLWNIRKEGLSSDAMWEQHHPDWNKMVLVPITFSTNSAQTEVTSVHHDMSLTSVRLVGGPDNANDPIRIDAVYAKFK